VLAELASVRQALLGLLPTPSAKDSADVAEHAAGSFGFDLDF
jgi:hypothetical protein